MVGRRFPPLLLCPQKIFLVSVEYDAVSSENVAVSVENDVASVEYIVASVEYVSVSVDIVFVSLENRFVTLENRITPVAGPPSQRVPLSCLQNYYFSDKTDTVLRLFAFVSLS